MAMQLPNGPLILIKVINNPSPLRWDRVAFISILSKMSREEKVAIIKPMQLSNPRNSTERHTPDQINQLM